MQRIIVEDMYECPFKFEEMVVYSEYSSGTDTKCTLLKNDCYKKKCPLQKEGSIKVHWKGK